MNDVMSPVTVIIPLYNKGREIARALRSVLAQTSLPEKIIVIDDGSTDSSADIVRGFDNPTVRLIQQANAGPSAARNRGIAESPTDLVALLDADDEWDPGFLQAALALHQRFPEAGMWGTNFKMVTSNDRREERPSLSGVPSTGSGGLIKDFFRSSLKMPIVCASGVVLSRTILDEVGWFPESMRMGEDLDLWIRIALRHPVAFSPYPHVVYHKDAENRAMETETFHGRDTSTSRTLREALAENREFAYTKRRSVRLLLGSHLLELARSAIANDDGPLARELIWEVARGGIWPMRCLRRWRHSYRDCSK